MMTADKSKNLCDDTKDSEKQDSSLREQLDEIDTEFYLDTIGA